MENLNQLPCAALVTDGAGRVLAANADFLTLAGGAPEQWRQQPMDAFFPPAACIFLQTHVWPMLLRDGSAREIYLKIFDNQKKRIPVMVNCRRGDYSGVECYFWVFFVAHERSNFEAELLTARARAEAAARALAEREHFVKTITDAMPGLVAYWDRNLRCQFANKPYLEWFGKPPEEVVGMGMEALLGERVFALNEAHIRAVLAGQAQRFERTQEKADGSMGYSLTSYVPDFKTAQGVAGFFVLVTDVTPIKHAEAELRLAASIVQNAAEGIMVTDERGKILSVNPAFTTITGFPAEDALGHTPHILGSGRHDRAFFVDFWKTLSASGHWKGEMWNRRKTGEAYLQSQTITQIRGVQDAPVRYVSVFNDITERWQKDEDVRRLAFHDSLTGLPNRSLLLERLTQLVALTEREQRNVALLFMDLDRFKFVNDTLGHETGDEVLKAVAQKLQAVVRHTDTVARFGGDEFVILLDNPSNLNEVAHIAARIIDLVNKPMIFHGSAAYVGASIGIAMHPHGGRLPADLIKNADAAMYAAKTAGKNTYCFFAPKTAEIAQPGG